MAALAFDGAPPRAADLSRQWRAALDAADAVVDRLPAPRAGEAVLTPGGQPFTGDDAALDAALENRGVRFHPGRLGGALPRIKP